MKSDLLEQLIADRSARRPVVAATWLKSGEQKLIYPDEAGKHGELERPLLAAFASDKSATVETGEGEVFLHVHNPARRLIVVGAVHIAQMLVPMAQLAGYDITIIDPRQAFATPERFPGATLIAEWPDEALERYELDRWAAMVVLTHDPKIDEPALRIALQSECFYVGALGSRKTHGKRCENLRAAGLSDEQIARIHGPIGLDIGSVGPAEIAISIIGEITASFRGKLDSH